MKEMKTSYVDFYGNCAKGTFKNYIEPNVYSC